MLLLLQLVAHRVEVIPVKPPVAGTATVPGTGSAIRVCVMDMKLLLHGHEAAGMRHRKEWHNGAQSRPCCGPEEELFVVPQQPFERASVP